jgi:hypothetical protein
MLTIQTCRRPRRAVGEDGPMIACGTSHTTQVGSVALLWAGLRGAPAHFTFVGPALLPPALRSNIASA